MARSRLYLAALITGGVAVGGGLTAAAHAQDAQSARPRQGQPQPSERHQSRTQHATGTAPVRTARQPASTPTPAAPQQSQQQSTQQQPSGRTHSS